MEQGPFSGGNQETSVVYYLLYLSLLSQINPFHAHPIRFLKIHFNIIPFINV